MPDHFRAVLFDLDGTLLESDMSTFLPHYIQAIRTRVAPVVDPKLFVEQLFRASEAMVSNDGSATNAEVFAREFYPTIGRSREEMEPILERFYAEDFPKLQAFVRQKPEARPVVDLTFALGYDVVIATNPLFPEAAIRQRMAWAGVEDFPYRLVTTYENSRFCKPNPSYFRAIVAMLGHPAESCLVVGDEHMDMVAARIGCPTFLVPGPSTELGPDTPEPTFRGSLADLAMLLKS